MVMVAETEPAEAIQEIEIIKSDNWELPVCNLGSGKYAWRPKTSFLPYYLFLGPPMTRRTHGLNISKDLCVGVHGPRGSTKTLTLSYLLAKKMRLGQPVWNNWPISFNVINENCWEKCKNHACEYCYSGSIDYYESYPLNMDKLYTFNSDISEGSVGITELQYYAEARTSGREQNRFLSYQLMQLRKSALSFYYDVQNPRWVDNRFGWSDDCKIFCKDVSKMNYDYESIGREIQEGEFSHLRIRDISGVLTGVEYENSQIEYGPYQFDGYHFWWIYPTKWKIDVYDAVYSMKQKGDQADREALIGAAIENAINSFLDEGNTSVLASDMWARATLLGGIKISPSQGGAVLKNYGISKKQRSDGQRVYDLSIIVKDNDS